MSPVRVWPIALCSRSPARRLPGPAPGLPDRSYARLELHYLNVARATEFAAVELLHRTRREPEPELLAAGAPSGTS
jgi:hypothetical protein